MQFMLPIVFALMGFLFSTRRYITTVDKLPPHIGLLVYYTILTIIVLALQRCGLVIGDTEMTSWRSSIGSMFIVFAFFITIAGGSCYVNYITKGHCNDISNIYFSSEDGAVYHLWDKLFPGKHSRNRLLTYIFTPFVFTSLGVLLLSTEKVKLSI